MSDVRLESGGVKSPEVECGEGPGHPDEYGGGGPLEYIEEGLITAAAAMPDTGLYFRS